MKAISNLVRYQLELYFKGSRFVMPFVVMTAFLFTLYSVKPVDIVDGFSVTCYLVFFIMVWIGQGLVSSENTVMEQIQLLRVKRDWVYYLGQVVFLFVLGLMADVFCLALPFVLNLVNHGELFTRTLTGLDMLNGFLLFCACSSAGGALGSLLHPRVMRDRKTAMVLTLLAALVSMTRIVLVRKIPVLKWGIWIFPPLDEITMVYGGEKIFQIVRTGKIFLIFMIYGVVYSLIKSVICQRKKF